MNCINSPPPPSSTTLSSMRRAATRALDAGFVRYVSRFVFHGKRTPTSKQFTRANAPPFVANITPCDETNLMGKLLFVGIALNAEFITPSIPRTAAKKGALVRCARTITHAHARRAGRARYSIDDAAREKRTKELFCAQ